MKKILILLMITISISCYAPCINKETANKEKEMVFSMKEKFKQNELQRFLDAIAQSESGGNYKVYNSLGYIGLYQFGVSARRSTGFAHISFQAFKHNPNIWSEEDQDTAMIRLMDKNEKHLIDIIRYVEGNEIMIRDKRITKSGVLSSAHLAGFYGVKKYFDHGFNPKDINGTSLENYLYKFSGYEF